MLGSPLGHPAFVARHLERTSAKHGQDPTGSGRPIGVVAPPPLRMRSRQLLVESGATNSGSELRRNSRCGMEVSDEHIGY